MMTGPGSAMVLPASVPSTSLGRVVSGALPADASFPEPLLLPVVALESEMSAMQAVDAETDEAQIGDALRRNRILQAKFRQAMAVSEEASAASRAQHGHLRHYIEQQTGQRRMQKPNTRVAASFFSSPIDPKTTPPNNGDAVRRALFREAYLASLESIAWSKSEEHMLENALRSQLQEEAFKRLYVDRTQSSQAPQAQKQRAFIELSREIREARIEDLWQMQERKTDWQRVSLKLDAKGVHRDAKNCFTHWVQYLHPQLNHGAFTKHEDMALLQLATLHGGFEWDKVAEQMETDRTPWQCFTRYQRSLNPSMLRSSWTEDEDEQALRILGQSGVSRTWYVLAARMGEGRVPAQVRDRLDRLRQEVRWRPWTQWESRRLCLAERLYGRESWVEVARHVPGRSATSCAQRFWDIEFEGLRRTRRPHGDSAKLGRRDRVLPWTEEEDSALLEAIQKYGAGNWCLARRDLPGRTTAECFRRFQKLNPSKMADMYDVLLATQKKMLPRRFEDGRRCKRKRSELVASDFALHLFEVPCSVEDADCSNCTYRTRLTTGDALLDRHLHRVNRRRWQRHQPNMGLESGEAPITGMEAAEGGE